MTRAAPISFARSQLDEVRHVCDLLTATTKSIAFVSVHHDGFECGDQLVQVVSLEQSQDYSPRLAEGSSDDFPK